MGDTICAISSAVGAAPRMIVRMSGPEALGIASHVALDPVPQEPTARRLRFTLRSLEFPGWIYVFRSPRSATGEDVVEFHIPGNPLLARMMLQALIAAGARQAHPGEFTARGYFNGKLDLAAAEGVAATIAAQNEGELRAAQQLLHGELARRLSPIIESVAGTLALIEAGIDFADEDISFIRADQTRERIDQADAGLANLETNSARFERLSHEPRIVLIGRPNAGKSTLLNALCGLDRAVVSDLSGTTRDALSAHVTLTHGIVRVTDVAGVDESEGDQDAISSLMRRRALHELAIADIVVLVHDCTDERALVTLPRAADLVVLSKADLSADSSDKHVSASSGAGMSRLRDKLDVLAFGRLGGEQSLALNARHIQLIASARSALVRARESMEAGPEIVAMELRESLDAISAITGRLTPDDVLGRIFAKFCIGK